MKPLPDVSRRAAENLVAHPAADQADPAPQLVSSRFTVSDLAPQPQLPAWRDGAGHAIDVLPPLTLAAHPFNATIDHYALAELALTDCRSDAVQLQRSLARIATDQVRHFAFQVFPQGGVTTVEGRYARRADACPMPRVLALDLNQPFRMQREAGRVLTLLAPRALVESWFPEAASIHGRVLDGDDPLTLAVIDHAAAMSRIVAVLPAAEAAAELRGAAALLVGVFVRDAGLGGPGRGAARAAMFRRARCYIQANLQDDGLSPASVVAALNLPRASVYRLFQHEGGLAAYIRDRRLRQAADELLRAPSAAVNDVAFGSGFNSASDFTRAFRRAFGMAPQEFRQQALEVLRSR